MIILKFNKACLPFYRFFILSIFFIVLIYPAFGIKIFTPPYDGCYCWKNGSGVIDNAEVSCNSGSGSVAAWSSALLGGVTAESHQYVYVTCEPEFYSKDINVDIQVYRIGGKVDFGLSEFSGTEITSYIMKRDGDHYKRHTVDDWLNSEIAIGKIISFVSLVAPTMPAGKIKEAVEIIGTINDVYSLYNGFMQYLEGEDYDIISYNYNYTLPARTSFFPVWAGVRTTAAACLIGTTSALSAGYVSRISISNIDPPAAPTITGPSEIIINNSVQITICSEGNQEEEEVSYWIDWDDGTPTYWTGFYPGDVPVTLTHTYTKTGGYLMTFKAKERDELTSLGPTYSSHYLLVKYDPLELVEIEASNLEYCDRIIVNWSPVDRAQYYELYREGDYVNTYTVPSTYIDTNPYNYTRYYVRACENPDNCQNSDSVVGRIRLPPDYPGNVDATDYSDFNCDVTVTWDPVIADEDCEAIGCYYFGTATEYDVYRTIDPDPNRTAEPDDETKVMLLGTVVGTYNTVFHDWPEQAGGGAEHYYTYWVKAKNECDESTFSARGRGRRRPELQKPMNLVATDGVYCDRINLTWDQEDGPWYYCIFRDGILITEPGVGYSYYNDNDVEPGKTYTYTVAACDDYEGCGCIHSDPDTGYIGEPSVPRNLSATDERFDQKIRVEWSPVGDATSYRIWRNTVDDVSTAVVLADNILTNTYDDTAVNCSNTYYYWVAARNNNCLSVQTVSASGSANCAPQIISSTLYLEPGTENLFAEVVSQDMDNNPVTNIYNWSVNGEEISVLNLPFDTYQENITMDYTTCGNHGSVNGARWIAKEKMINFCDSLEGFRPHEGAIELNQNCKEGQYSVRWDANYSGWTDISLYLQEVQDWSCYDRFEIWLYSNLNHTFTIDAVNSLGWRENSWWYPGVIAGWNKANYLVNAIHPDVIDNVASLRMFYENIGSGLTIGFDDMKLVRDSGRGGAFYFDGLDDYISVSDDVSLDIRNEITVEVWINPYGQDQQAGLLASKYEWTDGRRSWFLMLRETDNRIHAAVYHPGGLDTGISAASPLPVINQWNQVVFTFNSAELAIYLNGLQIASDPSNYPVLHVSDSPINIGYNPYFSTGSEAFKGMIDDVIIYRRALSADQIMQNWQDRETGRSDISVIVSEERQLNDVWSVEVTPTDGIVDGIHGSSPVAVDDFVLIPSDITIEIDVLANDIDPDGDKLTIAFVDLPANGTASNNIDRISYTPSPGFIGEDSFNYGIIDGNGGTNTGTVTVIVNNPPVAEDDLITTDEDEPVSIDILFNDSEPDGDPLNIEIIVPPENGWVVIDEDMADYTPEADFNGEDTFTYSLNDGYQTATATVTIIVNAVADPPLANDDLECTVPGVAVTVDVLSNDSDPDDEPITLVSLTQPAQGTAEINAGMVVYTPDISFTDEDSFSYTISDGELTSTATVTMIEPVCGDVNLDRRVNILDALLIARHYVGMIIIEDDCSFASADVNCDGIVNIIDALIIARFYVGLPIELNCC